MQVINPFIKRLFYVTSSQCGRKERCYFRRDIWDIVCLKAEHEYIENKLWHQLSDQPIQEGSLDEVSEKSMFLNFRRNMQPIYKTRYVPRYLSYTRKKTPEKLTLVAHLCFL